MYIPPIETNLTNLNRLAMMVTEEGIVKAVWEMGFKVDAEQLSMALVQDKKRYEYAYDQGYNDCKKEYEERLKTISEKLKLISEQAWKGTEATDETTAI